MNMDAEKEIIRDIWRYLRDHNDPPVIGTDACTAFWSNAAQDICELVSGKWHSHPLATEFGIAVYSYLETKCKAKA